ncbi:hypothetical protein PVAG01_01859 [Phlyctema vagabunda]|uniref:Alkyl hydroperoxide reductase subunit C/ Thiol specific antioxidant domain-containing protein n=1 Tax=Phlyctema vagabunda TaxID=108571 RepID=A0ABR4PY99_9HELO
MDDAIIDRAQFAEKTFQRLRTLAAVHHPKIDFVAISHSEQEATEKWIAAVGGKGEVQVIVDPTRELYARWGLSTSSAWHVLNPWSLYGVYRLGKEDGIWNRPTESGSRWQQAGSFAVDADDVVRWVNVAGAADEIADFEDAVLALGRSR